MKLIPKKHFSWSYGRGTKAKTTWLKYYQRSNAWVFRFRMTEVAWVYSVIEGSWDEWEWSSSNQDSADWVELELMIGRVEGSSGRRGKERSEGWRLLE